MQPYLAKVARLPTHGSAGRSFYLFLVSKEDPGMNRWTSVPWLATVVIFASAIIAQGADTPPGQARARQAALDFIKAWKARDKDQMLQLSSVPWLYDFTITFKTRQQLEDHLRLTAAASRKSATFTDTVRFVSTYSEFRPKIGKKYYLKWLDEVLTPEDFVVAVQSPANAKDNVYLFVRWKKQQARIAGYSGD
jgi:hypothetical protein